MQLSGKKQGEVSKSRKRPAAMTAGETAPAVMEGMMIRFCTNCNGDELMFGCPWRGSAARDQIWPRATDCVLDDVGEERREKDADEESQDCNVRLVKPWSNHHSPYNDDNQRPDSRK